MPLQRESWHVISAVTKAVFGYAFLASFLFQQRALGQDNITDSPDGLQGYDNGSSFCTDPGGIIHGHRRPGDHGELYFSNGTELEFICHSEYLFILGDGVITCISGHWVPPKKPLCIPYKDIAYDRKFCTQPPYTPFSVLNSGAYKEYEIGDTLYFDCLQGYQVVGSSIITCGKNGQWHPTPRCRLVHLWLKDIENRSSTPDVPSLKSETTSIMKIISYLAVPVLVGFVIAIMLNLKNHSCLHLANRQARSSQDTTVSGSAASHSMPFNHNNNTIPGNIANLHLSFQHYLRPFRPPSYPYNQNPSVYTVSSQTQDMGLPTYEEAIKESSPPSFDVACGMESPASSPDTTPAPNPETSSTNAPVESNQSSTA